MKSYRSLGEIPDILWDNVPRDIEQELRERLEHVENCVNRSMPNDVVDRCRDAISLIISTLAEVPGYDLARALNEFKKHPNGKDRYVVQDAANLVRLFHSRGKPNFNFKFKYNIESLSDEDAQLSLRCLGRILKDVNWVR